MRKNIRCYTLTEILVAVAVLMLMMTFLLQFVIGSQRIWYASSRTSSLFEKAQIVFDVMERDIKQSLFSNEKGENIPMFLRISQNTSSTIGSHNTYVRFGLVTQMTSKDIDFDFEDIGFSTSSKEKSKKIVKGTAFPVLYDFDRGEYRLYRNVCDTPNCKSSSGSQQPFSDMNMSYYGIDSSSYESNPYIGFVYTGYVNNRLGPKQGRDVLADDLLDFNIEVVPNNKYGNDCLKERPKAVRITITLFDHEKFPNYFLRNTTTNTGKLLAQEEEILPEARTFSKVIFLQ